MEQGDERRKFPRIKYPCKIRLDEMDNERVFLTVAENISCGGLCTSLPQSLDVYSSVFLEIDLQDSNPLLKCDARVVWCLKGSTLDSPEESFYVGVEFTRLDKEGRLRIKNIVDSHLGS